MKKTEISEITSSSYNRVSTWAKACLIPIVITLLSVTILAVVTANSSLTYETAYTIVLIISILCMIISGSISSRAARSRGWLNGGIAGLIYTAIPLIVGILALNVFPFGLNTLFILTIGFIAGAFGGILGINLSNKRK